MEIKGKLNLFVKDVHPKEKEAFKSFRTSIGSKKQDGGYLNTSVKVKFAGEKLPKEKTNKLEEKFMYILDVKSGFVSCESFTRQDGTTFTDVVFVIQDAKIESKKEITQKNEVTEDDIPF